MASIAVQLIFNQMLGVHGFMLNLMPFLYLQVFSIFMDTLVEVITIHKHMMHDWLYILITKMLVKCGGEMLASVATKTSRTLDTIL